MEILRNTREKEKVVEVKETGTSLDKNLILHNDEIHTFDYVIESLIKICKHNEEQAEQCTYIVHYKGKCDVKKGPHSELRRMRYGLIERGLKATIE